MISNPFELDAFNMSSLTAAINLLPNNYGRIRELTLFPAKSVRTRTICVEEQNGSLKVRKYRLPKNMYLQEGFILNLPEKALSYLGMKLSFPGFLTMNGSRH